MQREISPEVVEIDCPARLHLGFMDLNGGLGRRFGSLGLTIKAFRTRLRACRAADVSAHGEGAERAERFARRILQRLGIEGGVRIDLDSSIPGHLGLGSGTQMALAVGRAIVDLFGIDLANRAIAAQLERGKRSGIGIGAFEHGGFILDSGVGANGAVPPVTARLEFPEQWQVMLILDVRGEGLHGSQEVAAFSQLPPFPVDTAAHLCHLAVMKILPGVQEAELLPVAEGIAEIQRRVGDHFASAQGGRFTSPAVADALSWAESMGHVGVGQSSWGPTGFVLLPDVHSAEDLKAAALRRYGELSPLRFVITGACNQGGRIRYSSSPGIFKEMY